MKHLKDFRTFVLPPLLLGTLVLQVGCYKMRKTPTQAAQFNPIGNQGELGGDAPVGSGGGSAAATTPATPVASTPPQSSVGTSDSGGGNGVNGKMYESYAKDPTQLEAYKKYLAPIFENLDRKNYEFYLEYSKGTSLSTKNLPKDNISVLFKTKTWYIAPVDLKRLDKKVVGVAHIENQIEQIAAQTDKEVWIDSRVYNSESFTTEEQADIILHEFVEALYLLKFQTFQEISNSLPSEYTYNSSLSDTNGILVDELMTPEPKRALNEEDYKVIRKVTAWLKGNGSQISLLNFYDYLFQNGFDKRLFDPKNNKKPDEETFKNYDHKDLINLLDFSQKLGHLPENCYILDSDQQAINCQISFNLDQSEKKESSDFSLFKVSLHVNGLKTLDNVEFIANSFKSSTTNAGGKLTRVLMFIQNVKAQVGTPYYVMLVTVVDNFESPEKIIGITFFPYIFTKVHFDPYRCVSGIPKAKNINSSIVSLVSKEVTKEESLAYLIQQNYYKEKNGYLDGLCYSSF